MPGLLSWHLLHTASGQGARFIAKELGNELITTWFIAKYNPSPRSSQPDINSGTTK